MHMIALCHVSMLLQLQPYRFFSAEEVQQACVRAGGVGHA